VRGADGAGASREPQRTCVGCRGVAPQADLLRIARHADGSLEVGRHGGRGAYVHRDRRCVDGALRPAVLVRALRGGLSADEVDRLRERIERELESV
jgi:predicted RNA-binding protein YlxR (DUF448 family)